MGYFEEIKSGLKDHIDYIKSISTEDLRPESVMKIARHLQSSIATNEIVDTEEPKKLRQFIDYLEKEGRSFGRSFPENKSEEACESSFWTFKDKMRKMIGGMTANKRLYYFGYLEEFENLSSTHKSAKDEILIRLFML